MRLHVVVFLKVAAPLAVDLFVLALILYGTVRGLVTCQWHEGPVMTFFDVADVIGAAVSVAYVFHMLLSLFIQGDLVPFLWNRVATQVGLILVISASFFALLLNHVFLECIGVFLQPIIRPLFKNARALRHRCRRFFRRKLFTGAPHHRSHLSQRRLQHERSRNHRREIFHVIDAHLHHRRQRFGAHARLGAVLPCVPHRHLPRHGHHRTPPTAAHDADTYYPGAVPQVEPEITRGRLRTARTEALAVLDRAPRLIPGLVSYTKDAFLMVAKILSALISLGLGTLLLAKYTPLFNWLGFLFYPSAWVTGLPEPDLVSKAAAISITDMLLPATEVASHPSEPVRFVIGMVCLSTIICFNGVIPCIVGTKIPISIPELLLIWLNRVTLTILIAAPVTHLIV